MGYTHKHTQSNTSHCTENKQASYEVGLMRTTAVFCRMFQAIVIVACFIKIYDMLELVQNVISL
jgi:hypothetical protein